MMLVGATNGFTSSDLWKCTEEEPTGWTNIFYDDGTWTVAVKQTYSNSGNKISVDSFFGGATPIWSELLPNNLGWCRCRGNIGKFSIISGLFFSRTAFLTWKCRLKMYVFQLVWSHKALPFFCRVWM